MSSFKSVELYNYKRLQIIHDNWDAMPEDLKDGTHHIGDANLKLLVNNYLTKGNKDSNSDIAEIDVNYKYSKLRENTGRQYAVKQLSLQSMTRKIRHTITHDIYNDIDMKNAHHAILVQYCKKKGWECPELEKSVKNSDKYLEDIMKADNVSRGEAKRVKLSVSYGSTSVSSKAEWFPNFKKEIKEIHKKMLEDPDNAGLIDNIKKNKKFINMGCRVYNLDGKLCGHLMCEIENDILMACISFLKNEKICTKNIVLCFDGFMIRKEIFNPSEEILEKMSEYVNKKIGYKMKFVNKPQDEIISLDGLKPTKVDHIVVETDAEACNKLLEEMEGSIYSCKNNIYVKTKDTNVWSDVEAEIDREIVNTIINMNIVRKNLKPYSKDITGIRTLLSLIKLICPKNNELIEKIRLKSKGKLFFKDGVYDFSIRKFRKETKEDMTTIRINRNFPKEVSSEAYNYLEKILISIFNSKKQCVNMLQHGARGLAGHIEDKDFIIGAGLRDCGKGIITQLFTQSFGVYATEVNANNFLGTKRVGVSDEAKNRMWLLPHMWSRLIFANECDIDNGNEKAIINGVLIKSLMSGGDIQKARALYKSEIEFVFNGRLFMFMNDVPTIKPVDTCQHMTLFEFPNKFIMPDEYKEKKDNDQLMPFEKKADPNLKDKLKDEKYINAFLSIILDNYLDHPVKNTPEIMEASKEYRKDEGDELLFYRETFDFSDKSAFTPSAEVYDEVKKKYPDMKDIKIKSFLTKNMVLKYCQRRINGERYRGFEGIKIKNVSNDEL